VTIGKQLEPKGLTTPYLGMEGSAALSVAVSEVGIGDAPRAACRPLITSALFVSAAFDFERDEARQQCCWIELANYGLNIGETACDRMHWDDIAVTHRR